MLLAVSGLTRSLALVAPTLSILQCASQAVRIYREGADGVSLGTWILSVLVSQIWIGYGLVFHVPGELFANTPFLAIATVVVITAGRLNGRRRFVALSYAGVTVLTVLSTLAGLAHSLRWVLATIAVVSAVVIYLPQMLVTLRSSNLIGVSVVSWALALMTSITWGLYGIRIHQPAVALPSVVMIPSALVILIQVSRHRLRGRALEGSLAPIVE